jgi:hypothetical protein
MKLQPASNEQAFLKAGFLGFAKSGKSFTVSKIAIGLHKFIDSKNPVAFLDTETGSSYVLPMFKKEGVELLTAKSRAFVDLLSIGRESEKTCDILIIDSISHFWTELVKSYQTKMGRKRLRVQDWGPIKEEWQAFTDFYINSKLHILMCGRAGFEYDFRENEDGVTEIQKTGIKMKAESDMSFEPSLLIEMEKIRSRDGSVGQGIVHRAWVVGDRFDLLTGRSFDNPGFDQILPHVKQLNIGGTHVGIDLGTSSKDLFDSPEGRSNLSKRREIALECIQNEIVKLIPGRTAKEQQDKITLLEKIFGTNSWTAISDLHPDKLETGLHEIKQHKIEGENNAA